MLSRRLIRCPRERDLILKTGMDAKSCGFPGSKCSQTLAPVSLRRVLSCVTVLSSVFPALKITCDSVLSGSRIKYVHCYKENMLSFKLSMLLRYKCITLSQTNGFGGSACMGHS